MPNSSEEVLGGKELPCLKVTYW